jgi:hypothetical protein
MTTWQEIEAARLAEVQEQQALHRRLLAARQAGLEPDPADVEAAEKLNASPFQHFDRVNARDEY